MRVLVLLASAVVAVSPSFCSGQVPCLVPPPIPSTVAEHSADLKGAVDLFKALPGKLPIGSANAEAQYRNRQHDVLARFPNADLIVLREQELYYVCETLNADKKLSTAQRLNAYHRATVGLGATTPKVTAPARRQQTRQPLTPAPQAVAPSTQVPPPVPQQQCAPGSICNNGSPVQAPQTLNNYGPLLPELLDLAYQPLPAIPRFQVLGPDDPTREERASRYNDSLGPERDFKNLTEAPGILAQFHVSTTFTNPHFSIECDNPCVLTGASTTQYRSDGAWLNSTGLPIVLPPSVIVFLAVRPQYKANPITKMRITPSIK